MGAEAACQVRFKRQTVRGKARLETEALTFRGPDLVLSIPLKQIARAVAHDGTLDVDFPAGTATFELGPASVKWAQKIQHPPTLFDKLGVKPDWRVSVLGEEPDNGFLTALKSAVRHLAIGRPSKRSDAIFVFANDERQLSRQDALKASLQPAGALWIVRPKGRREIPEQAVRAAGLRAGLVDVKVVSFSPTHTAEKFVIPVASRPDAGRPKPLGPKPDARNPKPEA